MKPTGTQALISKITTTVDGGYSVTLSLGENDLELVQELMRIKKESSVVIVAFQEGEDK